LPFTFVVAAYLFRTPHSSGFGRLASGAFYAAIPLATFYEITAIGQTYIHKISPDPSFPKRGNSSLVKGGKEGFGVRHLYNDGLINNRTRPPFSMGREMIPPFGKGDAGGFRWKGLLLYTADHIRREI
jgi:hypothetical protein